MAYRFSAHRLTAVPFMLAALAVGIVPAAAQGTVPFTRDLAFDQIVRLLTDATPPPPDSFASDAARIAALPPMPSSARMSAALDTASAMASNPFTSLLAEPFAMAAAASASAYSAQVASLGAAYAKAGSMQHAWFYRGWSRIEGPQGASIAKPDEAIQLSLNTANRTFRRLRPTSAGSTVETYVVDAAGPISVRYDETPSIVPLDRLTLAGLPARGYQTDARFETSGALGFCSRGTHVVREVEYVADFPDPQATPGPPLADESIAREACSPALAGSHRRPGRFVLFRSTYLTGAGSAKTFVLVLERGNMRSTGPGDTPLFSVPPDFTEEK